MATTSLNIVQRLRGELTMTTLCATFLWMSRISLLSAMTTNIATDDTFRLLNRGSFLSIETIRFREITGTPPRANLSVCEMMHQQGTHCSVRPKPTRVGAYMEKR
jgi:hypothetical protein